MQRHLRSASIFLKIFHYLSCFINLKFITFSWFSVLYPYLFSSFKSYLDLSTDRLIHHKCFIIFKIQSKIHTDAYNTRYVATLYLSYGILLI